MPLKGKKGSVTVGLKAKPNKCDAADNVGQYWKELNKTIVLKKKNSAQAVNGSRLLVIVKVKYSIYAAYVD